MPIRPYAASDAAAVYDVCLRTGASGDDATGMYADPALLGHVYAGPYVALHPRLAFVLEDVDGVAGYVLGARDTRAFEQECEAAWWPGLRARYRDPAAAGRPAEEWTPDERVAHLLHEPPTAPEQVVREHPSHLHIDLLPRVQGRGGGRRLIETLFGELVRRDSPGVHVGVSSENERALGFYRRVGFAPLAEAPGVVWLGRRLP